MVRIHRPEPKAPAGINIAMKDIDWPVPVLPGDKVSFGVSEAGKPVVTRIERAGVQLWPAPIETAP